jgi:hypothetical protein
MTPEEYRRRTNSCKSKQELQNLISNTKNKGRFDLAEIAENVMKTKFPSNTKWKPSTGKSREPISYHQAKEIYKDHPALTDDQIVFLAKHHVPAEQLFNAKGISTENYKIRMRDRDCHIAYGTTPCVKGGHTLRTSSGHCFQCDPKKISFSLRHRSPGEVYIAESSTEPRMVKVGSAELPHERVAGLNTVQYGGRHNWVLKYHYGVKNMGLIESETHASLARFAVTDCHYLKDSERTICRELFSCTVDLAHSTLKEIARKYS